MDSGDCDEWLTWPEAAELVGCPVPTIDWHTRTGRIEKRPKVGNRPSLKRSSVEEFAVWWREREARRAKDRAARQQLAERRARHRARAEELGIRPGRIPALAPDVTRWLTTNEAAAVLSVSHPTVKRLARDAGVRSEKIGNRWWLDEGDVRKLAEERSRWVSFADAAAIVGCSEGAIKTAVNAGRIRQRDKRRVLPSLDVDSVREFASEWAARKQSRAEKLKPSVGPPQDGHVWLDSSTAALVLGISRSRISQLALAEKLPSVTAGSRRWFRRSDIEAAAAARVVRSRFSSSATRAPSEGLERTSRRLAEASEELVVDRLGW